MPGPVLNEESYLRNLPNSAIIRLSQILDVNNLWEKLVCVLPSNPSIPYASNNFKCRYTTAEISHIRNSKSCTRSIINDLNMDNFKIKHLIEALYLVELNAAAVYLEQDILHAEPRSHCQHSNKLTTFCALNISEICVKDSENKISDVDNHSSKMNNEISINDKINVQPSVALGCESQLTTSNNKESKECHADDVHEENTSDSTDSQDVELDSEQLTNFPFSFLKRVTGNFNETHYKDGGNLIGQGGFGKVFVGIFKKCQKVAVKYLKDSSDESLKQFNTEVETLIVFKHENLVLFLGYSRGEDGAFCLVYQYLSNGSLEERLACRYNTEPLPNKLRLSILKGTASGLVFLHKGGLVHRDIKSANILLDDSYNAKVGDFATARMLSAETTSRIMKTSVVIGTMAYLAPEALSFVVHKSLDSYSFGVVILEVLTGLPVTDPRREERDLKMHVKGHCSESEDADETPGTIHDLLDRQGGEWIHSVAEGLYALSCHCLELNYLKRPLMDVILSELEKLTG